MSPILLFAPLVEITVCAWVIWWSHQSRRRLRLLRAQQKSLFLSMQAQYNGLSNLASPQSTMTSGVSEAGLAKTGDPVPTAYSPGSSVSIGLKIEEFLNTPEKLKLHEATLNAHAVDLEMSHKVDLEMSHKAMTLMFNDENYQHTVDLLLKAAGCSELIFAPLDVKMKQIIRINDGFNSAEDARAWFQRALELTY